MAVRFSLLLAIYLVVPVVALVVLVDLSFLSAGVRQALPANPEQTLWYVLLFGLPHIVASELTFLRRDYLRHYRNFLLVALAAAATLAVLVGHVLSTQLAYVVFAVFTMIHVVGQQVGISRIHQAAGGRAFALWKWTLIGSAAATTVALGETVGIPQPTAPLTMAALALLLLSNLFFFMIVGKARNRVGYWYCLSTHLMVTVAVLCFALGYSFFAVLLPRVVHDVTAFVFYTVHEHNRVLDRPGQKPLSWAPLGASAMFYLVPLGAIGLAFAANVHLPPALVLTLIFLHYALESRIWRRNSPHRAFIRFA